MIWIDLEHKLPTDTDIPNWTAWTNAEWEAWKERSQQLLGELAEHEASGNRAARNKLIDDNSTHWGKLKPWLSALSGGKCWFSEAKDLYAHYDVEHFRPKKEAKEIDGAIRDGYWWLAFNHMNFRLCGNVGNRKKGGWFPLRAGSPCSTYGNQCEENETAHLLDPIDIDDVTLLAFDEEGKAIAKPGASDWERERVEHTVLRMKLNEHEPLSEARRKIWQKVTAEINQYQSAKARSAHGGNEVAREKVRSAARAIHSYTRRTEPLSSVARWCVLMRNDPQLALLAA